MGSEVIFLISKLWIDPLENRSAYGYEPFGFVKTEEEAKIICESEMVKKSDYPWPLKYINGPGECVPRYTFKPINVLDISNYGNPRF